MQRRAIQALMGVLRLRIRIGRRLTGWLRPGRLGCLPGLDSLPGGILIFFSLSGDFVLRLFGIGLPAFQLAGGFIFFVYALQMLRLIPGSIKMTDEEEHEGAEKASAALVPLATPLLAGPGAITAVLVWRRSSHDPVATGVVIAAIVAACLAIFLVLCFGTVITRILGLGGIRVVTRLTGLLLAVIAVQFMVEGVRQLGQQ